MSVTSSAVSGVPQEDAGVASALLNSSQEIGGSLGLAVLTAVATARFDAVGPLNSTPATIAAANTSSWAYAFVVAGLLLFTAAIVGGWLLRPSREQPQAAAVTGTDGAISVVRVMAQSGCHG